MKRNMLDLPDYNTLKKLASILWKKDNSYQGAAVMVGAGFSRSAAFSGDINAKMPLWNDFSGYLSDELNSKVNDPLRLAEEYNAYFGKQALNDLIKKKINDISWRPGELHSSLLKLPWSEVLTTNWDTLLERASRDVHDPIYSIVTKQEDLSNAKSPRIVKLHGTIDVTKNLVFTQEDYRRYPQEYAAFVNFSRQVFIENELCLLGFSGDDPNFLQWAGWVRDNLNSHSRRIYLVGALGLSSAKRKYLEAINIAPIDLSCLVLDCDDQDRKHFVATQLFISFLNDLKPISPREWTPRIISENVRTEDERNKIYKDSMYAAKILEDNVPVLSKDRESYPGWLVCPHMQRNELKYQISEPYPTLANLRSMSDDLKVRLLYELSWRFRETYQEVSTDFIEEILSVLESDESRFLNKKEQSEMAVFILKYTRYMSSDGSNVIKDKAKNIIINNSSYFPEFINEIEYHNAILARDIFDYNLIEQSLKNIRDLNPEWKIKKASLLSEIGMFSESKNLVIDAFKELLIQHRDDNDSTYILSRLLWANWLVNNINKNYFDDDNISFASNGDYGYLNPDNYIEYMEIRISNHLEEQNKQLIEPLFEMGSYKDNTNKITFSSMSHPFYLLDGMAITIGIPVYWDNVSFLGKSAANISYLDDLNYFYKFSYAIRTARSDSSPILNKVFSRIKIASYPQSEVDLFIDRCECAIKYFNERISNNTEANSYYLSRLQVFIEVLARLSIRAAPIKAKEIFCLSLQLAKQAKRCYHFIFDTLKRLSETSLKSIPRMEQSDVLYEILSFPIESEMLESNYKECINLFNYYPGKRTASPALDKRINEIIESIDLKLNCNTSKILRVLPLCENGFLTGVENEKLRSIIWEGYEDYHKIPNLGVLPHVVLMLPGGSDCKVKTLVNRYFFESHDDVLFDSVFLESLANMVGLDGGVRPSEFKAMDYFDKLVSWRSSNKNDPFGFFEQKEKRKALLISKVLAYAVTPFLPKSSFTLSGFNKINCFYKEYDFSIILMALPYFSINNKECNDLLDKIIKDELSSRNNEKVANASYVILKWKELLGLSESSIVDNLILRLVYLMGVGFIPGLQGVIWTVNELYLKGYLSREHLSSVIECLPVIFDSYNYNNDSISDRELISIPLIRSACIKFASEIIVFNDCFNPELNRILEESKNDSLPEVRFAYKIDE